MPTMRQEEALGRAAGIGEIGLLRSKPGRPASGEVEPEGTLNPSIPDAAAGDREPSI